MPMTYLPETGTRMHDTRTRNWYQFSGTGFCKHVMGITKEFSENKRHRTKVLTHYAEWSYFAFEYFFRALQPFETKLR